MKIRMKTWVKAKLSMTLIAAAITACGPTPEDVPIEAKSSPTAITAANEAGEAGHSMDTLPVEKRVAFMSGHVQAGLALFRAGASDEAAQHLLHPVSEMHEAERAGIDSLGFDQAIFRAVSTALEEGRPAAEIEPQLAAAEANMVLMQQNAGGDPVDIIAYLMDTVLEEYRIGVKDGVIADPGEYQDAFGFTVVALDIAKRMEGGGISHLISELEALLELWPEAGPLANSMPTPVTELETQTSLIHIALTAL